jgi:hypothetical protein
MKRLKIKYVAVALIWFPLMGYVLTTATITRIYEKEGHPKKIGKVDLNLASEEAGAPTEQVGLGTGSNEGFYEIISLLLLGGMLLALGTALRGYYDNRHSGNGDLLPNRECGRSRP